MTKRIQIGFEQAQTAHYPCFVKLIDPDTDDEKEYWGTVEGFWIDPEGGPNQVYVEVDGDGYFFDMTEVMIGV